jgi:hypothetical protein
MLAGAGQICGTRFFGERILIGTAAPIQPPAPAGKLYRSWCALAGVVVSGNSLSPVKECWPELGDLRHALLRREGILIGGAAISHTLAAPANNLYGSWGFPPVNGLLTGVGLPVIDFPPVKECWPELADLWRA